MIDSALFKDLFGNDAMRDVFSERNTVQKWLDFEAALARAEAKVGLIPEEAAREISQKARAELLSMEALKRGIDETVHPIVPLVREFASVCSSEAGEYIHWGTTTQDVMDTAAVLQLKEAFTLIESAMEQVIGLLAKIAREYRDVPMVGRTHGQQALPITLGYKVAVWLDEMYRHRERLQQMKNRVLVGQFSGAVGTLASIGAKGHAVQRLMMEDLGIGVPLIAWHASRDRIAEAVSTMALLGSTLQKIANEVATLQKTEFGELEEPFHHGKVGSSTMPHKRNPMVCESVYTLGLLLRETVSTALAAMVHEHERDMRIWPSEWDVLPRSMITVDTMLRSMVAVLTGLTVNQDRMAKNLDLLGGTLLSEAVMMYLAERMGRQSAHEAVYEACVETYETGRPLQETLLGREEVAGVIDRETLVQLLDPVAYLGESATFVDQVLRGTLIPG